MSNYFAFQYNYSYNKNMITSTQNQIIKDLIKLSKEKDVLCLDNPKLIEEALKKGLKLLALLKTEKINKTFGSEDIVVADNVLEKFTNVRSSRGVVALVKYKTLEIKKPIGNFLILDRVQDPGNVGTLIRSAVGSGFLDIYLIDCASVCNSKTVRSTMGAIFKANLYEVNQEFINTLKTWNLPIYVADMNGKNIYQTSFAENCGIIVGNEGQGVSEELRKVATGTLCIPMQNCLESLNAGVSGSIIMYQITNGGQNVRS